MSDSRKPDFILKVKSRDKRNGVSKIEGKVGAGWLSKEKTHISIQLDTCVVLSQKDDIIITLFSNDFK